jgi:ribosomal protein S27AE
MNKNKTKKVPREPCANCGKNFVKHTESDLCGPCHNIVDDMMCEVLGNRNVV